MKKQIWIPILIIIVVLAIISIVQNKDNQISQNDEPIKIGAILPLSGDLANFGNDILEGMNLFIENNPQLDVIIEDDKGDSKESLSAFRKLENFDKVNYFFGPFGPVAAETVFSSQSEQEINDLTFIAVSMCSEQFREYDNMLCNYPSPYYQLKESYRYPKTIGKESFYAVLPNDSIGEGIYQMLFRVSSELGLQLLGDSKVNVNDVDFYTTVDKAISKNPDFVVIATMQPQTNFTIIKELKERGYEGMIMSGGDFDEDMVNEFRDTLEGVYLTGQAKMEFDREFISLFNEKYDRAEPNLYQAYGYMWAEVFYNLAKKSSQEHFTIYDVVDYINLNSNDLAIKNFEYDEDRSLEFPMKVMLVRDGSLEEVFVSE